jgi:tyrosyl-tRNA synthetase
MGRADSGLSYTEFSYQILQAFDFLTLYREHGCTLQIGGSDQWGNITAGIDLIRRKTGKTAHGLTLPLVTKSDGTKFGKTESGTIWLDPSRTTAYEMYQFWLNTADADVDRYLRYFTFLPLSRIDDLAEATRRSPEEREAQRVLAAEVTALIHGEDAVTEAEAISAVLFTGKVDVLTPEQAAQASRAMTATEMSPGFEALPAVDLVTAAKLAESKKRARELMAAGAIQVNGKTLAASDVVSERHALHGRYFFVRRGKKTYHAVVLAR